MELKNNLRDPGAILVIQLRRVGDVLLTTPAITNLRKRFPSARIDFLAEPPGAEVLEGNPFLDEVLTYDKSRPVAWLWKIRRRHYDWVIDFLGNPRSAVITAFSGAPLKAGFDFVGRGWVYNHKIPRAAAPLHLVQQKLDLLRALGVECLESALQITLSQADRTLAETFWENRGIASSEKMIGIAPVSRRATRRWTSKGFAALSDRLQRMHGCQVLVFWGPGDESQVDAVLELMEKKPLILPSCQLREMAGFLERCNLLITNDNGPMHLAEAVGTPTLTVYGPTQPAVWNPGGPQHRVIQAKDVSCLGCNLNKCPTQHECMEHLSPEEVEKAAVDFLAEQHHVLA